MPDDLNQPTQTLQTPTQSEPVVPPEPSSVPPPTPPPSSPPKSPQVEEQPLVIPTPSPKQSRVKIILASVALLMVLVSVPAAIYLVQQRQELRREAQVAYVTPSPSQPPSTSTATPVPTSPPWPGYVLCGGGTCGPNTAHPGMHYNTYCSPSCTAIPRTCYDDPSCGEPFFCTSDASCPDQTPHCAGTVNCGKVKCNISGGNCYSDCTDCYITPTVSPPPPPPGTSTPHPPTTPTSPPSTVTPTETATPTSTPTYNPRCVQVQVLRGGTVINPDQIALGDELVFRGFGYTPDSTDSIDKIEFIIRRNAVVHTGPTEVNAAKVGDNYQADLPFTVTQDGTYSVTIRSHSVKYGWRD